MGRSSSALSYHCRWFLFQMFLWSHGHRENSPRVLEMFGLNQKVGWEPKISCSVFLSVTEALKQKIPEEFLPMPRTSCWTMNGLCFPQPWIWIMEVQATPGSWWPPQVGILEDTERLGCCRVPGLDEMCLLLKWATGSSPWSWMGRWWHDVGYTLGQRNEWFWVASDQVISCGFIGYWMDSQKAPSGSYISEDHARRNKTSLMGCTLCASCKTTKVYYGSEISWQSLHHPTSKDHWYLLVADIGNKLQALVLPIFAFTWRLWWNWGPAWTCWEVLQDIL